VTTIQELVCREIWMNFLEIMTGWYKLGGSVDF